jgi:hypothetical protein
VTIFATTAIFLSDNNAYFNVAVRFFSISIVNET